MYRYILTIHDEQDNRVHITDTCSVDKLKEEIQLFDFLARNYPEQLNPVPKDHHTQTYPPDFLP